MDFLGRRAATAGNVRARLLNAAATMVIARNLAERAGATP
jgi:hypothetical protein